MCDSPAVFRCYIRTHCSLQTKCCRVHLEAAWGNRSSAQFDWHVLTSPNEPKIFFKNLLQPDSHAVNEAGLLHKLFPTLSHHYSLVFSPSLSFCLSSSGSVPTVPPGNVQAEAVNSTTVRFTWSAPSPQFINGINQGYKVSSPCLSTGAL